MNNAADNPCRALSRGTGQCSGVQLCYSASEESGLVLRVPAETLLTSCLPSASTSTSALLPRLPLQETFRSCPPASRAQLLLTRPCANPAPGGITRGPSSAHQALSPGTLCHRPSRPPPGSCQNHYLLWVSHAVPPAPSSGLLTPSWNVGGKEPSPQSLTRPMKEPGPSSPDIFTGPGNSLCISEAGQKICSPLDPGPTALSLK